MLSHFTSIKSLVQETRNSTAVFKGRTASRASTSRAVHSTHNSRFSQHACSIWANNNSKSIRYYSVDPKQLWDKAPPGMKEQITKMKVERAEDALMEGENVRKGFAGVRIDALNGSGCVFVIFSKALACIPPYFGSFISSHFLIHSF